jgi:hypothetical protein
MKKLLLVPVLVAALLCLLAAPALASPKTFYVSATRGGGDNTTAIQAAFNHAIAAGPGSVVQLGPGHFYTDNMVLTGFDGYFRGAGEGKTIIDTVRGWNPNATPITALPGANGCPMLFAFSGGHVRASDMSFDITSSAPAAPWNGDDETDLLAAFFLTDNASSSFDHISFTSACFPALNVGWGGYVMDTAIFFGLAEIGGTGGHHSVTNCSFTGGYGMRVEGLTNGSLVVGGAPREGNVFDTYAACVLSVDSSNSQIVISYNRMSNSYGSDVQIGQGWVFLPALPAPHYLVADNKMLATGTSGGLWVEDDSSSYNVPNRLSATIVGNDIHLDNGGNDAGLDGLYASGVRFLGNRVWGTGFAGIDVGAIESVFGGPSDPAFGWQIVGNDFSNLTVVNSDLSCAPEVWLGPDATRCFVVGGLRPTTVLDQGTDDTLINVTPIADPPAAAAKPMNSLKQLKQLKGMMLP